MRHIVPLLLVSTLTLGCSSEDTLSTAPLGSQSDAILYGELDTTHQAVGASRIGGIWCTATIVHVDGNQGYALTAAHCIGGATGILRQGDNRANGAYDVQYNVVETAVHPEYNESQLYDFGMLRFNDATAATPSIPVLPPAQDNLQGGTSVNIVGYGQTEVGSTTLRHHILRPITAAYDLRLEYNQQGTNGGICSGDSGGPTLKVSPDRVGGVSSYVSPDCYGTGVALRASAVHDTFVQPFIAGTAYQAQTCDQCSEAMTFRDATCWQEVEDCFSDQDCDQYYACLQGCGTNTCALWCEIDHPSGAALFADIWTCVCDTGCSAECQNDALCEPGVPCGMTANQAACQLCLDGQCCAQGTAVADDPISASCYTNDPHQNCPTPQVVAFDACLDQHCETECGGGVGGEGGGGVGGGGGLGGGAVGGGAVGGSAVGGGVVGGGAVGGSGGSMVGGGGAGAEGGSFQTTDDGGCGCIVGLSPRPRTGALALLAGLLLWGARRRRH